ncbi:MAG: hypothetical protein ICV79_15740 [Flavisolibacter sp.]|nr:hypothetical protein [Flavisolibacter sp.]
MTTLPRKDKKKTSTIKQKMTSMNTNTSLARVGAVAAFLGVPLLFVSTLLHPMQKDPNDPLAAFAEYAANSIWVWSHLGQFAGIVAIAISWVALAATFEQGRPAAWGRMALVGTATVISVAAALQAVDGVALKVAVDRWAAATGGGRELAFEAAFAVRQIEIGLAALLSIVSGLTLTGFSLAVLHSTRYPVWLGWIGLVNAVGTLAAGAAQASTGFSDLSMTLSMLTSSLLLVWVIIVGILLWRLSSRLAANNKVP